MKTLIISFLILVSSAMTGQSNDDYTKGIVDFSITDMIGREFTQNQLTNDKYKLLMYFNPSCSGCKTAFKKINLIADELKDLPIHFYPISLGNREETLAFFDQYAPNFMKIADITLLREKNYEFADLYEVTAYPTLFLYKPNDEFVKSYMGYRKSTNFLNHFDGNNQ